MLYSTKPEVLCLQYLDFLYELNWVPRLLVQVSDQNFYIHSYFVKKRHHLKPKKVADGGKNLLVI